MLQGNCFAEPMWSNLRDMPKWNIEPALWATMTRDTDSVSRNNIVEDNAQLIEDDTLANQVASIATQLRTSYTFQDDFLECIKSRK